MAEGIQLGAMLSSIFRRWLWIGLSALFGVASGYAISFAFAPRYSAEVVVIQQGAQDQRGLLGSLAGQFGGLAALAGVDLGGGRGKYESIEVLQSRALMADFVRQRELMPTLFAEKWDSERRRWRSVASGREPTVNKAVDMLERDIVAVTEDRRTGTITVRVSWRDPVVAADWANQLVAMANARMRDRALSDSRRSLEFLNSQVDKVQSIEVREALFRLIESQYKSILLASVDAEFALRIVDPATPVDLDDFDYPNRVAFALLGLFVGLAGAIGLAVWPMLRIALSNE